MSDCKLCQHYVEEPQINFAECMADITIQQKDAGWFAKTRCVAFLMREDV